MGNEAHGYRCVYPPNPVTDSHQPHRRRILPAPLIKHPRKSIKEALSRGWGLVAVVVQARLSKEQA